MVFINSMVASGFLAAVRRSEGSGFAGLVAEGIREFMNVKTVSIAL